ncbi:hypothetical protein ACFL3F_00810 [Planctomycetota bacterium]
MKNRTSANTSALTYRLGKNIKGWSEIVQEQTEYLLHIERERIEQGRTLCIGILL